MHWSVATAIQYIETGLGVDEHLHSVTEAVESSPVEEGGAVRTSNTD